MAKKPVTLPNGDPTAGREALAAIQESINRKHGVDLAMPMDRVDYVNIHRLPFGVFTLDYAARGGIPLTHYTRLWGPRSALKTTLCLRLLAQAQKTCRHCKYPIEEFTKVIKPAVIDKKTGEVLSEEVAETVKDCRCPNPRWVIPKEAVVYYAGLTDAQAFKISVGLLPEDAKKNKDGSYFCISKNPGASGSKRVVSEEVKKAFGDKLQVVCPFVVGPRCEPMRTLYVDTDRTADIKWVKAHDVDPSLVMVLGALWGEQIINDLSDITEFDSIDLILIDSLSGFTPKEILEKSAEERARVAGMATLLKRLFQKLTYERAKFGLSSRYAPTIVCTSQVSTHGIGGTIPPWLAPANGMHAEHAFSLDIKLSAKAYHMTDETTADFADFTFDIKKNKVGGSPNATGILRYRLLESGGKRIGDGEDIPTVMKLARERGLIFAGETGKEKYVFKSSVTGQKYAFATVGACEQFLRDNATLYMGLRNDLLNKLFEDATGVKPAADTEATPMLDVTPQNPENKPKSSVPMKVVGLETKMAQDGESAKLEATGLKPTAKAKAAPVPPVKKTGKPQAPKKKQEQTSALDNTELSEEEKDVLMEFVGEDDDGA